MNQVRQEKAKKYAKARRCLAFSDLALAGILLLLLVFSGLSVRLTGLFTLPVVPAATIYFFILMVTYEVLSAPISYYRGFVLPHYYGLSIQKFTGWLGDEIKARLLSLASGAGIVAAIYWFITSFPQVWWLLTWALVVLLSLILTNLAPIIIVPLFFKMKPLDNADLKLRLEQLAQRAKARVRGIYAIELSSKGTTANAALMGLGNTKRIVLSDTLLQRYSPPEIEIIIAHELGHHRHSDTFRLFVILSAIWLVGFYVTDLALKASALPLGFNGISDIAALPLLMLIFATFSLLVAPVTNTYHRYLEVAADDYALRLTDNPKSFINTMTKLTDQNLSEAEPSRWVELLIYDHPSYSKRVEHAEYYSAHKPDQQSEGK
ncbi:MAG: M48 family metallopeptidase [Dehalococcoidales bacterium]|nr:M48 family metallopeptidase [Dehalococcoidales bacterium]